MRRPVRATRRGGRHGRRAGSRSPGRRAPPAPPRRRCPPAGASGGRRSRGRSAWCLTIVARRRRISSASTTGYSSPSGLSRSCSSARSAPSGSSRKWACTGNKLGVLDPAEQHAVEPAALGQLGGRAAEYLAHRAQLAQAAQRRTHPLERLESLYQPLLDQLALQLVKLDQGRPEVGSPRSGRRVAAQALHHRPQGVLHLAVGGVEVGHLRRRGGRRRLQERRDPVHHRGYTGVSSSSPTRDALISDATYLSGRRASTFGRGRPYPKWERAAACMRSSASLPTGATPSSWPTSRVRAIPARARLRRGEAGSDRRSRAPRSQASP